MQVVVSAIITTHNRINLLPRAIDSVLSQTYQFLECIVVSDNSTDGTVEYCNARKDIQFIDIQASESKGGNYARNRGILASKGEYVAFLDDDDFWLPGKIEQQIKVADEKHCGLVYCGRKLEHVAIDGGVSFQDDLPSAINSGNMAKRVLNVICTTTSSILLSREILDKVGLFDENLSFWQEYELCIRLAQETEFYFVPEALVVYRVDVSDKGRLTNKYEEWWGAVEYILHKHKGLYSKLSFNERRLAKLLIYRDAYGRSINCGLDKEGKMMLRRIKIYSFPEILRDKIRAAWSTLKGISSQ